MCEQNNLPQIKFKNLGNTNIDFAVECICMFWMPPNFINSILIMLYVNKTNECILMFFGAVNIYPSSGRLS